MVEHLAVQFGLLPVVGQKRIEGRSPRPVAVAHADRQPAQFVGRFGHGVRLQVEHDLQPMLDLAEESVVLFQNASVPGA